MSDEQQDFERRMFDEGQAVYDRMVAGEVPDVVAALMEAHLRASTDEK